jgi:hypothetical protein
MRRTTSRAGRLTLAIAIGVGVVGLAACGDDYGSDDGDDEGGVGETTEPVTDADAAELVGEVEGGDAFVAIVAAEDGEVTAYVCDGEEGEMATTGEWFTGELDGTELLLEADSGATLEAELTDDGAVGTYTSADGTVQALTAEPAEGEAGLYRGEDGDVVAGFVVANDGDDRGGIGIAGRPASFARPAFSAANPVLLLPALPQLQLALVQG